MRLLKLILLPIYSFVVCWLCQITPANGMCELAIRQFEKQNGIPDKLLMAISIVESGRMMPGKGLVPWPWTINANGKSYVFPTKAQAITKVRQLQNQGIRSIDVGCMQINLKHHPTAFNTLEEAFDPFTNIAYAARFLKQKKEDSGSWHMAVGHYHSIVPSINAIYKQRVLKAWEHVQKSYPIDKGLTSAGLVYSLKHSGEFETELEGSNGKKMPLMVQFGPYTGLNRSKPTAEPIPTVVEEEKPLHRPRAGAISGGFFQVNATSNGRGGAAPSSPSGKKFPSPGGLMKANYQVKQMPVNKMQVLSRVRPGFFRIP